MIAPITRSLEEGSDYSPDWRHQVVAAYLKKHAADGGTLTWEKLLGEERDVVIRQVVRYHLGSSLIPEAVRYALGCQQHNELTGMASNIRAMAMAGCTYDQIANEVETPRRNIFIFCRLFFDVERYINNEFWLETLLRRDFCGGSTKTKLREQRLLKNAYNTGMPGVIAQLAPRQSRTSEEIEDLSNQVRYSIAARAKEFVEELDECGVPPGPDDFSRHLMVSAAAAKAFAPPDRDNAGMAVVDWLVEAAEREIFIPAVNEKALTLKDTQGPGGMAAGGRRAKCLMLNEPSKPQEQRERVDCEREAESRTDDKPVVVLDLGALAAQNKKLSPDRLR